MKVLKFGKWQHKLEPATDGEKAAYTRFKKEAGPQLEKQKRELFEPRVRGFRNKIIPSPKQNPCEICKEAEYNKLCPRAKNCGPLLYVTLWRVGNIASDKLAKEGKKCSARSARRSSRTRKTRGV